MISQVALAVIFNIDSGPIILHTLAQLKSGELAGIQHLKLSESLTTFPSEILSLADTLEILDLSHNHLARNPLPPAYQ
ncbi:hypothetical protein GAGA_3375 [Paraglaciecola agarilytica NO2]|uniref:Uncharacterized protein n=1 Tax=Paraglaciecola agarilytica NO2 TaxID=1125747 RepID=A0ABQ0IAZ0_9ALTE|nr:hypothetical protein GAGA_3375 [Paraglaciecola agarilytica NO2]